MPTPSDLPAPSSPNITTQQLEYLLAIERSPTWARAAASVGVSPSALSQGVAELERRLGVSLFDRDGRRRVPSRDHPEVLRYAESTVAATRDLGRWLGQRRGGQVGEIRLGMIDAAATHHFRDVLLGFRTGRPDVELRLTVGPSGALLEGLRRADLDVVVCVRPAVAEPGIEITPVFDDPLAVLAPPGTAVGAPSTWGPWVTFPSGSHTRGLIGDALRDVGSGFEVVAESHQPEVLREMVLLGIGWTVLPLAGLGPVSDLVLVREALTSRSIAIARRAGTAPDKVVDDLVALLGRHGRRAA